MVAGKYRINNFKNLKDMLTFDQKFYKNPYGFAYKQVKFSFIY